MRRYNIAIVDDEPLAINVIKNHLKNLTNIGNIYEASSPIEALEKLSKTKFDILFLDINMPHLNGFDLLKLLDNKPEIILVSAYSEYALKGFDYSVTDYLLKPVSLPRFLKGFSKAVKNLEGVSNGVNSIDDRYKTTISEADKDHIIVRVDRENIKLLYTDIFYIESFGNYVKFITDKGEYLTSLTMSKTDEMLRNGSFVRCHRGYIINLQYVKSYGDGMVVIGEKVVPVGRNYKEKIDDLLKA